MCIIVHFNLHMYVFRTGQDPKNFARENLRRIRKIQVQSKIKQGESSKPMKVVHKSDKYDHIQPKVTLHLQVFTSIICVLRQWICYLLVSSCSEWNMCLISMVTLALFSLYTVSYLYDIV